MKRFSLLLLFLFFSKTFLFAHQDRPAYLNVTQLNDSTFQVTWKVTTAIGQNLPNINPVFPNNWKVINEQSEKLLTSLNRGFIVKVKDGVEGGLLFFEGQKENLMTVLVSIQKSDGAKYTGMVRPNDPNFEIPLKPDSFSVVKTYFTLGVEHILIGIDHLLFVLALLMITVGFKKLVKTITAFTIAHSITLSLATLEIVSFPSAPVEAIIALSIVFLAVELIHYYNGRNSLTVQFPWVVAFSFGLLHGFGFAGALSEIGLPQSEVPLSLLFFNVGVEAGQLLFVSVLLGLTWLLEKRKLVFTVWSKKVVTYAIGCVASFWLIERVIAFLP